MWQQKWQKFGEKLVQTPVYLATTGNNSAKTLERTPAELCKTLKRIAFKSGFSFAGLGNVLGGVAVRPTSRCFGCTPYQIPGFVMHSLFGIPLWVSGRWHPWKYLVCPVASLEVPCLSCGILGHPWASLGILGKSSEKSSSEIPHILLKPLYTKAWRPRTPALNPLLDKLIHPTK